MQEPFTANANDLTRALAHAGVGLVVTDLCGNVTDANDAYCGITGYSIGELKTIKVLSLVHHPYRQTNEQLMMGLAAGEIPSFVAQCEYIRKSGELVWVQTSFSAVRDDRGAPLNLVALCEDITERKVIQKAIRESEERFRVQFKATPVPIYSWRRVCDDFVLVDYNDAAARITHRQVFKLLGRKASELYVETPGVLEHMNECFVQQRTIRKTSEFYLLSTGQQKYLDVSYVFVPPDLVMAHTEDITERISAERARLEAERKYRDIFENANEGIFQSTPDGRFLTANPAMARIFGFESAEQLIAERTNIGVQQYVDPQRREQLKQLLSTGKVVRDFRYEAYRKDGTRMWISESVRSVRDKTGEVLYFEGITEDITDRKIAEEAQRNFSRRLIEAQESERKHIARELHDEIGQVLMAVRMNLQTLERQCETPSLATRLNEDMLVIDEALKRVRDLSFELRPSLLDDLGLAAATRWFVGRHTSRAGITASVIIDIPESETRLPRDVETACFRILQEALTNTARHAHADLLDVSLRIIDSELLLCVKDNGVGMDCSQLRKRGNHPNTLGLRGMEERALAVAGQVDIVSQKGAGTEVKARFPIKETSTKEAN